MLTTYHFIFCDSQQLTAAQIEAVKKGMESALRTLPSNTPDAYEVPQYIIDVIVAHQPTSSIL